MCDVSVWTCFCDSRQCYLQVVTKHLGLIKIAMAFTCLWFAGWFPLAQKSIQVVTVPYTCYKLLGILIVILIWEYYPQTQFSGNNLWGFIVIKIERC